MRNWHWLVGVSVVTAAAGFAACGGSSDDGNGGTDAGTDVGTKDSGPADTGPADTGPAPPGDASVPCVFPDAALGTLDIPDAAIDDAGASIGKCIACSRAKCGTETTTCETDCVCTNAITGLYECLGSGSGFTSCVPPLIPVFQSSASTQALGTCVLGGCQKECGIPNFGGGGDAGTDSGADAGTPADSGSTDAKAD
jgi:hypothetical protein